MVSASNPPHYSFLLLPAFQDSLELFLAKQKSDTPDKRNI